MRQQTVEYIVNQLKMTATDYLQLKQGLLVLTNQRVELNDKIEKKQNLMEAAKKTIEEGKLLIEELTKDWAYPQTIKTTLHNQHQQIRQVRKDGQEPKERW